MEIALIEILKNLGLNLKEAKVYLACIENGTAPVSTIASTAKINRVTTYDILDKLKKKGLVSHFTKNKVKYFNGTDPDILLEEFEKRTNDLRTAIPKFKQLTGETAHPRVRYFEGLEGIKSIYTDTLTAKTEILNYSNSKEIREIWPNYDKEYVAKRAEKRIFLKGICPDDAIGQKVHREDEKYFRRMQLIPESQLNITNEINIYDDKVAIISFKDELIGMIIESTEIANSQRAIFNMCWNHTNVNFQDERVKNSLLAPLSEEEVKASISEISKPLKKEKKELKEKNLCLF
ncbi:hypothetical protein GF354_01500 [Candidatus Peregrinibacteria bacterium]|nr:hypothetical protein [Candidatus Peregrinibacteria bacterium]